MAKLYLAALLALDAASVAAQPAAPAPVIQPNVDSPERRQALQHLTVCLAEARPRWARRTLEHPYLSEAQAHAASEALSGQDGCIRGQDVEVTFRTSTMVGSLAEHFVRTEIERVDSARLATALHTLTPLNVSEDFALCVTASNPTAARRLAFSDFGSPAETEAAGRLGTYVARCTGAGESLTVDLQSLRALTSVALYRGIVAVRN